MKPVRNLLAAACIVLVVLVAGSGPAGAHTGFESSDPADGSVVDQPVETITLVFTGDAEPTGDGFELLDPTGTRRQPVEASSVDGTTWVLRFDPAIAGGTVGVRWTVKAPDAHPIDGSFSFEVTAPVPAAPGDGGAAEAASPNGPEVDESVAIAPPAAADAGDDSSSVAAEATTDDGSSSELDAVELERFLDTAGDPAAAPRRVGAAARVLTLLGTLVGVGALVFAATALRGEHGDVRHVLHWVRRAGVIVVLGAVAELLAQIGVEGSGWSGLRSPSEIGSVLASSFGVAVGLRIIGGLALVSGARLDIADAAGAPDPVVALRERVGVGAGPSQIDSMTSGWPELDGESGTNEPYAHPGDHAWVPSSASAGAGLGALALVAAHLFDGHTVTKGERLLTSVVDVVHVTGAAVWAGGVFMLVAVLWRRHRRGRPLRALQLAVRFSVVATLAVVAVGAAGAALTVIVLDTPSELWATQWGQLLMLKTIFVVLAGAAGGYNHRVLIPRMNQAPDDPRLGDRFRTVVTVEAVVLVAVLVVTALLMGAAS